MTIQRGDTVTARGRTWTAVTAPTGDVDMIIADPHFTDAERAKIARVGDVNERKKTVLPTGVHIQRDVLDINEITAVNQPEK